MKESRDYMLEKMMSSRKSVREFKKDYVISDQIIEELLEKSATAPSGHNLQSWRVAIVRDPQKREAIKKIGHNQNQITSASVLLVIYADKQSTDNMEEIYSQDVASGFLPKEMLEDKIKSSVEYYASQSKEYLLHTSIIDSSLFAMQLMLLVKERGYDSVPMRGFSQSEIGKIIETPDNYVPLILLGIGKAEQPAFNSSRLPVEKFTKIY